MLEYLSGKFYEVKLTTNATRLSEKLIHTILGTGVNLVVFSVDASTPDFYEQIRVRGKFDVVHKNIKMSHEIRQKYDPNCQTVSRISAVKFREDQDPEAFCSFWQDLVDEVGMKNVATRWDTYNNAPASKAMKPCAYLWERLYIWQDGLVSPCDADYKSELSAGNIAESTIKDVW